MHSCVSVTSAFVSSWMKNFKKLTAPLEVAHKCPLRRTLNRIFQLIGGPLHSFLLILPPKPQEHDENGKKHEEGEAAKHRKKILGRSVLLVRSLYVTPLNVRQCTTHHSGHAWSQGLTGELRHSGAMNWCQSERCDIDGLWMFVEIVLPTMSLELSSFYSVIIGKRSIVGTYILLHIYNVDVL